MSPELWPQASAECGNVAFGPSLLRPIQLVSDCAFISYHSHQHFDEALITDVLICINLL